MSLVFIPLYISFMGMEAYGLVGFFATLQAMFSLLDMGLSTTMNREMARLSVQNGKAEEMRNLVRTLELIYWVIAAVIGIAVLVLAPFIAQRWVKASQLAPATIQQAIMIMGVAMAFQWPFAFYSGGLLGLQRQVLLNNINAIMATLRGVGSVLILWRVAPTIQAFFAWQIVISALQTCLVAWFLWRSLPRSAVRTSFQGELLRGIWRFAAGMSGITIAALILTQMDKIILSRLLTLEMFGYYTLAGVVAAGLYRLIGPIFFALYPRFTQLATLGDQEGLKQLYHQSCQFMSVVILPLTVVMVLFSKEILFLWTQNATTVERTHLILALLVIGTALNGLMNLPYALQLAYGWTKLAFYINVVAVLLLVPLIIVITPLYGPVGAAIVWITLNGGYVLIDIQLMHRRLLRGEQRRWYVEDVGMPLGAALFTAGLGRLLVGEPMSQPIMLVSLIVVSIVTLIMSVLATSLIRVWVLNRILYNMPLVAKG